MLRRFEDMGAGLVPELRNEEPPTFECHHCLDTGYKIRHLVVNPSAARKRRFEALADEPVLGEGELYAGTVSEFCGCERGIKIAAGYWMDKIRPVSGTGRRTENKALEEEFRRYMTSHFGMAHRVQATVNDLIEQYERERKRKVREFGD